MGYGGNPTFKGGVSVEEKSKENLQEPSKYGIYLLNNDYIAFEIVVEVLSSEFYINAPNCFDIAQTVHNNGKALIKSYTRDIAETKAEIANQKLIKVAKEKTPEYSDCATSIFQVEKID